MNKLGENAFRMRLVGEDWNAPRLQSALHKGALEAESVRHTTPTGQREDPGGTGPAAE